MSAHALALLALDLDGAVADGAAAAAGALQLGAESLQERGVARQAGDHGHRLAAAAGLFDAQSGDDPGGYGLVAGGGAAARGNRRAAVRAEAAGVCRVDGAGIVAGGHVVYSTTAAPGPRG